MTEDKTTITSNEEIALIAEFMGLDINGGKCLRACCWQGIFLCESYSGTLMATCVNIHVTLN